MAVTKAVVKGRCNRWCDSIQDPKISMLSRQERGFPKLGGYHSEGPKTKDHSIVESIYGSPYFGKLPYGTKVRQASTWQLWGFPNCWLDLF